MESLALTAFYFPCNGIPPANHKNPPVSPFSKGGLDGCPPLLKGGEGGLFSLFFMAIELTHHDAICHTPAKHDLINVREISLMVQGEPI
jgi:hypothetical protein